MHDEDDRLLKNLEDAKVWLDSLKLRDARGKVSVAEWAKKHGVSSSWILNRVEKYWDIRYVEASLAKRYCQSIGLDFLDCVLSYKLDSKEFWRKSFFLATPAHSLPHVYRAARIVVMDEDEEAVLIRSCLETLAAHRYRVGKLKKEYGNRRRNRSDVFQIALDLVVGVEMAKVAPEDFAEQMRRNEEGPASPPLGLTPNGFQACEKLTNLFRLSSIDFGSDGPIPIIDESKNLIAQAEEIRNEQWPWLEEFSFGLDFDYVLYKLWDARILIEDLAIELTYGSALASQMNKREVWHLEDLLHLDWGVADLVEDAQRTLESGSG